MGETLRPKLNSKFIALGFIMMLNGCSSVQSVFAPSSCDQASPFNSVQYEKLLQAPDEIKVDQYTVQASLINFAQFTWRRPSAFTTNASCTGGSVRLEDKAEIQKEEALLAKPDNYSPPSLVSPLPIQSSPPHPLLDKLEVQYVWLINDKKEIWETSSFSFSRAPLWPLDTLVTAVVKMVRKDTNESWLIKTKPTHFVEYSPKSGMGESSSPQISANPIQISPTGKVANDEN